MSQPEPSIETADDRLQELCERGSELLMQTKYLQAERTLAEAERTAWASRDWDTLSRLYMPLQECRRQRRQRCGEGTVCLDLVPEGPDDRPDPEQILEHHPHGQLLVAGWGDVAPAARIRELAEQRELYVETFLAAAYPLSDESAPLVAILPTDQVRLPPASPRIREELLPLLPPGAVVLPALDLLDGPRPGDTKTYAHVMALWERLHRPLLEAADRQRDPVRRMEGYRETLQADYACELAHQKLSMVAHQLTRAARQG
jgi:hypothetical protein